MNMWMETFDSEDFILDLTEEQQCYAQDCQNPILGMFSSPGRIIFLCGQHYKLIANSTADNVEQIIHKMVLND